MGSLKDLEKRLEEIENRNKKVEGDKAWELSYFRKFIILFLTYLAIGIYMQAVNLPDPWLNAIIPSVAFMLSTLTLPFFKEIWLKLLYK